MAFLLEKRSKPYFVYGNASIAEEKVVIAQKRPRRSHLRWVAGRRGVLL